MLQLAELRQARLALQLRVTGTPGLALSSGGVTVGPVIPHLASIRAVIADLLAGADGGGAS